MLDELDSPRGLRIETSQFFGNEKAVLPNELVVEVDLPTTVLFTLITDDVPVNSTVVAIGSMVVAFARCDVEASADLLVEQRIADGLSDSPVDTEGKFTHVARTLVSVEDLLHGDRITAVTGGLDDLAILEDETHAAEALTALGDGHGIVVDVTIDRITDRSRVDFTIGNVAQTGAGNCSDALDAESQIGIRTNDVHLISGVHQIDQRLDRFGHGRIVCQHRTEEKVLEVLGGHAGQLCESRSRPTGQNPAGILDGFIHREAHLLVVQSAVCDRNATHLHDIAEAAESDANIGCQHSHHESSGIRGQLTMSATLHAEGRKSHVRQHGAHHDAASCTYFLHDRFQHGKRGVHINLQKNTIVLPDIGGIANQNFGQLSIPGIHGAISLSVVKRTKKVST